MRYVTKSSTKHRHDGAAWLAIVTLLLLAPLSFGEDKTSAEKMLAQLDRIRLPARSFVADLSITDFRQGKKEREGTFRLYLR